MNDIDGILIAVIGLAGALVGSILSTTATVWLEGIRHRHERAVAANERLEAEAEDRRAALDAATAALSAWFFTWQMARWVDATGRRRPWWRGPFLMRTVVKDRILRLFDDRDTLLRTQLVVRGRFANSEDLHQLLDHTLELVDALTQASVDDLPTLVRELDGATKRLATWPTGSVLLDQQSRTHRERLRRRAS